MDHNTWITCTAYLFSDNLKRNLGSAFLLLYFQRTVNNMEGKLLLSMKKLNSRYCLRSPLRSLYLEPYVLVNFILIRTIYLPSTAPIIFRVKNAFLRKMYEIDNFRLGCLLHSKNKNPRFFLDFFLKLI